MDRLTRDEIEAKHNAIAAAIALVEGMSQKFYEDRWQAAADLRARSPTGTRLWGMFLLSCIYCAIWIFGILNRFL